MIEFLEAPLKTTTDSCQNLTAHHGHDAVSDTSPLTPAQDNHFVNEMMPVLVFNANAWARRKRIYGDVRDDMLAEILAIAWEQYCVAIRNGHDLHAGHLWWVAIRRYGGDMPFAGRRISRDICSRNVMQKTGHEMFALDRLAESENQADASLGAPYRRRMADPAEYAAARIDLAAFKAQLDGIDPAVLDFRIAGYLSREMARIFKQPSTSIYQACARLKHKANRFFVAPV